MLGDRPESASPNAVIIDPLTDPNLDVKGKPGPNGEAPEEGCWRFISTGMLTNRPKKWKWMRINKEKEMLRGVKRAAPQVASSAAQKLASAASALTAAIRWSPGSIGQPGVAEVAEAASGVQPAARSEAKIPRPTAGL